ncbi:MAG: DoxX family protein [Verrucomicrobiota bacterium]
MKSGVKFLQLGFVPGSVDMALLLLRLWFGLGMLGLHGWGKLTNFGTIISTFPDPLGIGSTPSLVIAVLTEVLCPILLIVGAFTRLAALGAAATMAVAWLVVHGGALSGPESGELAAAYLGGYAALFLAGGGHYSMDAKMRAGTGK